MNSFQIPLNPEWVKVNSTSIQPEDNYWEIKTGDFVIRLCDFKDKWKIQVFKKNPWVLQYGCWLPSDNAKHAMTMTERLYPELRIQWAWPTPDDVPHRFDEFCVVCQKIVAVEDGIVTESFIDENGYEVTTVEGRTGKVIYSCLPPLLTSSPEHKTGDIISIGQTMGHGSYPVGKDFDAGPYLRSAWSRVTTVFHKDNEPIPTEPQERKKTIQWLNGHDLWTYETFIMNPPKKEDRFEEYGCDSGQKTFLMKFDGPGWVKSYFRDGSLSECVTFDHVYVCPWNYRIMDDDSLNTAFRVWVEAGGWEDQSEDKHVPVPEKGWDEFNKWITWRSLKLETAGNDLEDALLNLARCVKYWFGDSDQPNESAQEQCEMLHVVDDIISSCEDNGEGFCKCCGHIIRYNWYEKEDR